MRPIGWRAIFLTVLTLVAAYTVAPTVIYFTQPLSVRNDPEAFEGMIPSWLPKKHIKLGLDLQGGVQLVLGVNTDGAIESKLNRTAVEITRWAKDAGFEIETAYYSKDQATLNVKLNGDTSSGEFNEKLRGQFAFLVKLNDEDGVLSYGYSEQEKETIKKSALEQAERVIRSRVDHWGVTEPMINRRVDGNILVQLPGFRNPERAKELLGRTAQLTFKIVDDQFAGFSALAGKQHPEGIVETNNGGQLAFASEDRQALTAYLKPFVPEGRELLVSREALGDGSVAKYRWTSFVVNAASEVTGDDIQDAMVSQGHQLDPTPFVSLQLTPVGGRRFADVTGDNVGKRLAIILDEVIEHAPVISERIPGGQARIGLGGTGRSFQQMLDEGQELALILKSGAIPARIDVLEQREVGASLGPELANQGIRGVLGGLFLVLLFMLVYYVRPGMVACLALLLNALFLLAVMACFGFALTLPGIAGFVLTLGMAVDANVLINERIKQELQEGRHPRKAVDMGFKKVFWTIFDSNVTTIIAAVVLLELNPSGPIRGFAVTLILGLLVSLFTALYGSRFFFDLFLRNVPDNHVKQWLGATKTEKVYNFKFFNWFRPATATAFALALLVVGTAAVRGLNLGVDFAGGTEFTVRFEKDIESDKIREVADESQISGLSIQALEGKQSLYLVRYDEGADDVATTPAVEGDASSTEESGARASANFTAFKAKLLERLADYKPEVLEVGFVGPQIGKELRVQGMMSVLYAILAIMLYIALRFDMRFAPGATVKMLLDVSIMASFYVFFWASFDLVAVAAFLTVVGYSVNDTIVIYDRIRENIDQNPHQDLRTLVNTSLNETLTRSINTSVVTVLSLVGILVFGTGQIWDFAVAMALGVIVATTTSTFVASNFVIWMDRWIKKRTDSSVGTLRQSV
jgi:protein-export membrane protein SecD/preprotein translocase SecF subunit